MFNLGFSEIVIIGILALLLIGPKQLPEMARVLGRLISEFKKATSDLSGGLLDIKRDLHNPMREGLDAINRVQEDILKSIHHEDNVVATDNGATDNVVEDNEKTVKINLDDFHKGESANGTPSDKDEPKS